MAKRLIFLCITIFSVICANLNAMESFTKILQPSDFPLQKIIESSDSAEVKLEKLQTIANFLVFHAETYQNLKNIVSVMRVLHELQPYRVIDTEGKKFLSAFRVTDDPEATERFSKEKKENSEREFYRLNVFAPEAASLVLQLGHLFRDWKLKSSSKVYLLDLYLKNENENIRSVAGLVKHYVYSYQLAHLICVGPHGISSFCHEINNGQMDESFIDFFKLDKEIYQDIMCLPYMREIIVSTARLFECYRASGVEDDFFEMYIDQACLETINYAETICKEFERYTAQFQKLYENIRAAMARIIATARKDREQQQELRITYYERYFQLFNTNPSKTLHTIKDLPLHYVVDHQLPPVLEYTIQRLKLFAPAPNIEKKSSFLPKTFSQSAPAPRKKVPNKKKNKSQPGSRSKSPNLLIEESKSVSLVENEPVVLQEVISVPKLPSGISYDSRVLRWFDPLTEDKEVVCASRESIEYHCFSRLVDRYLFKYGIQTPWQNKTKKDVVDTNYSLGGMIEDSRGRKTVVFTCCIDPKRVCYHRGFDLKNNNNELFEEYFKENQWKVFHRDEFPPIGEQEKPVIKHSSQEDVVTSEDDLCVKIRDNNLDMNIILYKQSLN